jgi:hypothetical protein
MTAQEDYANPVGIIDKISDDIAAYNERIDPPANMGYTQSGMINNNFFKVGVSNGEKPKNYRFKIKAVARGNNIFWTEYVNLAVKCPLPENIPLTIEA